MTRPSGIDLFAGAGGMSLGFEDAGFDIVAAVEVDPVHASAHHHNFPLCKTLPQSVSTLSGGDIRRFAGLGGRPVDVVFGGAPCQGFSLIGQRLLDDPRNALVKDFVRLVAELDAGYFVFENVKGLTIGRHRQFLDELIQEFWEHGYDVRSPWRVLNAASYGVPQDRERLFLLGCQKGSPLPEYPVPVSHRPDKPEFLTAPAPTCQQALSDLPEAEDYDELLRRDWVHTDDWALPSPYASQLRRETEASWGLGYRRSFERTCLTSSLRTNHTEISRRRFANTKPGTVEPISRFLRLPKHGVSNTLRAGTDSARGAFTSPRPIHYERARCVTVREMARLHGFPDWFRFHATKWHGARQIGNAVPPPMAQAVASELRRAMEWNVTPPEQVLDLGDAGILQLNMTEAARHWGIDVPIGRRDRKSGNKKRRQDDIEAARIAEL